MWFGRLLSALAVGGSLTAYAVASARLAPVRMNHIWPLFLFTYASGVLAVVCAHLLIGRRADRDSYFAALWNAIPTAAKWVGITGAASLFIAVLVFQPTEAYRGNPVVTADGYGLFQHGRLVAVVDEAGYWSAHADQVRMFAGIWSAFGWPMAVFFWLAVPRMAAAAVRQSTQAAGVPLDIAG